MSLKETERDANTRSFMNFAHFVCLLEHFCLGLTKETKREQHEIGLRRRGRCAAAVPLLSLCETPREPPAVRGPEPPSTSQAH